ncbi:MULTISPECIES: ABC-F family ATP-binding cassette domain-containing protein [Bacillota]|uniref:ABC-F type ribosomal protection protein n=1 Tax=Amedibacillus hominis TaxID=2897776 RepID=A0ABS9R5S6_9FIRM|nr:MULTISPECIES: ABC-F type ribosomal protection protein [Bacillota]MCH4285008.1 ABC-F type ribosomal protection protein [Amedibacillus hominis]RGB55229.1 ABC transporter ATP-binding protein [Absiella sp. AM22-9]RGB62858.1 ABC transporter ATP-binding protein [Absiella sp. AM10-20]RGB63160.1 ABC transporter ATP-binding protein [Absiella sp. AM09-45]RGB72286.1 ABC transporter ATP-binding protein [Absiella sp. AM09-50]
MKYQIHKGTKQFGADVIFEDIQFEIRNTEKIAIVGRNGCGKTTLLKVIADIEHLDKGEIHAESALTIGYLAQTTFSNENALVEDELEHAFDKVKELGKQLELATTQMSEDPSEENMNRFANLQQRFEEMGGYTYHSELMTIFTKFGFQEEDLKRSIATFSGGQKTRLAFVKLLLSKPDVLLLDEPTNHLDIDTIEWLEGYVKRYPKAVVLVSHDRMFLDDVVDVVYEIEYGVMRRYPGNYTNYVNAKKSDLEQQKSAYVRQQKEIQRMEELIEKFRYKKNKAAFAQSKIKYLDRMDRIEDPKSDEKTFKARFTPNVRGGKRVLEVKDLTIGYDHPLCTVNLEVMQGQKVAIIGPNGKGKSTLMKTLMQQIPPLSGGFLLGHQIEIGYFDQELAQFDTTNTVIEEVWKDFPDLNRTEIRTALGCFLFSGDDVFKTVDCLSGGEKVRLSFVKLMLSHPNLLMMDEPTNHLDLIGKEALEDSLNEYEGTMLFVSHDRYFISKLATAILVIDDGKATYYPLTYNEYMHKEPIQVVSAKEVKVEEKPKRQINYGKEISKLEKKIEVKEKELEDLRELRFDPEYYHDVKKMDALDAQIDDVHNEIEHLMEQWEEYSELMG